MCVTVRLLGKVFFFRGKEKMVKPPRRHSLVLPAAFHVLLIVHLACIHRESVVLSVCGVCVCEFVCLKGSVAARRPQ